MEVTTHILSGSAVSELGSSLDEVFTPQELHVGDGFVALIVEKYEFWRTNSNMQATIIVDQGSSESALVKIAVGGGATGLHQTTLGSETKILRKLNSRIEELFSELELSVEDPRMENGAQYECEDCGVLFRSNQPKQYARCSVCGGSPSPEE